MYSAELIENHPTHFSSFFSGCNVHIDYYLHQNNLHTKTQLIMAILSQLKIYVMVRELKYCCIVKVGVYSL